MSLALQADRVDSEVVSVVHKLKPHALTMKWSDIVLKLTPTQEKSIIQAVVSQAKRKNQESFKELPSKYHLIESMVAVIRAVGTQTMVFDGTVTLLHKKEVQRKLWSSFCPLYFDTP